MRKLVFVYGTLKQGYGNNRVLRDSKFLGPAVTCEDHFDMVSNGSYPYVLKDGNFHVKGELYEVISEDVSQGLDWLEGYPTHYDRIPITARLGDATECVPCEIYVAASTVAPSVKERYKKITPNDNNVLEWNR